jgi:tRNA modification GTPase
LSAIIRDVKTETTLLVESFRLGNAIRQGVSVVIAGKPNAGKSTLLNKLLNEERAIISHIPGTTRDFIEDVVTIDGIGFRFTDTAGIASTADEIEKEGIRRTYDKLSKADMIIYLLDVNQPDIQRLMSGLPPTGKSQKVIYCANKADLLSKNELAKHKQYFENKGQHVLFISSQKGTGIAELKKQLIHKLDLDKYRGDYSLVNNIRHYRVLKNILSDLKKVEQGIKKGLTKDLVSSDLRHMLSLIGSLTADVSNNEVLQSIFSRFCIGK